VAGQDRAREGQARERAGENGDEEKQTGEEKEVVTWGHRWDAMGKWVVVT